ncbi:nucleoside-diphosphate-sugar epimerase [Thermocatellispora tengchongensis]|uniref:Nucleoside-diphosphate-sugar epimerase n=1 Tax=Thermocatellispora tengchongensis TaxID=1073253 RepID=A0A840P5C3_9ACTN|nr:NAD-dependent epimerase/dehydratase family protein [Thermocatellispora tengchongensis]MBB5133736.1 nucleoside-diphosphate-sugar epimerase [Thermocatellispora tengchongensis]
MNVLVIGATGFIGAVVAAALAGAGHDVSALRHSGGRATEYRPVPGDLTDPVSLTRAAAGFDRVVHAGPPLGADLDLAGVDALLASGSPLVYTTGAAVLGGGSHDEDSEPDPHPVVAWRAEVERRVRAAGGRVVRPGMLYGEGGGSVPALLAAKAAERGTGVYIGEPGVRWPVVHVADLAALYVAVVEHAEPGTVWHGMSETVRLDELARVLGGGTAAPWPLEEATAELGPIAGLYTLDQDISSDKTRRLLDWTPKHTSILAHLSAEPPSPAR